MGKVLIDIHNDSSIYYCGNKLGRGRGRGEGLSGLQDVPDGGPKMETISLTGAGVWEWPLFAAGRIWTESIMEVFAVQTYFSTEFLAFFETLLQMRRHVLIGSGLVSGDLSFMAGLPVTSVVGPPAPDTDNTTNNFQGASKGEGSGQEPSKPPGQFDQLVVTPRFKGEKYESLAKTLIMLGAMPLGLYRPAGFKNSTLPYTHVNPSCSERLVLGDVVFVLRSKSCQLVGSV